MRLPDWAFPRQALQESSDTIKPMRIPLINSDPALLAQVEQATSGKENGLQDPITWVPLASVESAIDYINYQTPLLLAINLSDPEMDAYSVMQTIAADPWLNHGGIIVLHEEFDAVEKLETLQQSNIITTLQRHNIHKLLSRILDIILDNSQILFQRTIQSNLIDSIYGTHMLPPDTLLIPCHVNMIGNYLFNMGFIEPEAKARITLSLTEMLANAIEHGVCQITSAEKTAYLAEHSTIEGLITKRASDPDIAGRMVKFQFDIQRTHSIFQIEDEGNGFDWRPLMDKSREIDPLAQHGRGIFLTLLAMDEVKFNEKGNAVTLRLGHRQNTANAVPLVFQDQEVVHVKPGDEVFRQGEASNYMYYVAEGRYRVTVNGTQVAMISPADLLIGEMSFLLDETRSATVVAATEGRLMKISKAAFINNIRQQPYYGLFLARLLAQRLDRMSRTFAG